MTKRLYQNQALSSTALAFSPQMTIDRRLGSVLSNSDERIPPGVEIVNDTHFRVNFHAPSAQEVALRTPQGNLLLEKDRLGIWSAELEISTGGFRPLLFTVDGVPVINPAAPIGFGASMPTNVAELPQPDVDFYHLKDIPHGAVTQEFYPSSVTGRHESCLIYTPPGYMRGGDETYPVLYLQHGHGENEHCWVHQGKVNFIMDNLLSQQKSIPCLIIMNNGMVQESRGDAAYINSELLEAILVQDCIPYIERTYRVKNSRLDRAMAGLSMGSLQTSIITLSHPELFAWAGVFSGFLQPLPGIIKRRDYLNALENPDAFRSNFRLFFRAMGTEDPFYYIFEEDSAFLSQKRLAPEDCDIHLVRTYSGSHEWNVWRRCIYDFLQLVFKLNA